MRRSVAIALLLCLGLAAGCANMPTESPVVAEQDIVPTEEAEGFEFQPPPPQPGESPASIVTHFLDAMTAVPVQTSVARKFLSTEAQSEWQPEQEMIVFESNNTPTGRDRVTVKLSGVSVLGPRRVWQADEQVNSRSFSFPMVQEDGEWRIQKAPQALIVSQSWFVQRFQQVALYYLNRRAEILVSSPVFVPRGEQFASSLLQSLVSGPMAPATQRVRTFLPSSTDASVTVQDGLATVSLQAEDAQTRPSPETVELMYAQLVWTMRQVPQVQAVRIMWGGEPLNLNGSSEINEADVGQFDPGWSRASGRLYAVSQNRVVLGNAELTPIAGPLGEKGRALSEIAVDLLGDKIAAVPANRESVWLSSVSDPDSEQTRVATGNNYLKPAWDYSGRLWLLDNTAVGARIHVRNDDESGVRLLKVPGISGKQVEKFLVSRAGNLLIAVLKGKKGGPDKVVASRIHTRANGKIFVPDSTRLLADPLDTSTVVDIAWQDELSIGVLTRLSDDVSEVLSVAVDGSSEALLSSMSSDVVRVAGNRLIGSPVDQDPLYIAADTAIVNRSGSPSTINSGARLLTYVG